MKQLEPLVTREDEEGSVTRRDLVRVLFKRRWTVLACFVLVTAVTAAGVARLPPTYEARAKVLVQTEQQVTPSFFSGVAAYNERRDWDPVNRRLENEMALIEAGPISDQVVRELSLDWDDIYHPPMTHVTQPLVDAAAPLLETLMGMPYGPPSEAEAAAALQASLGVSPGESKTAETTSNIIVVTLKAPKPDTAQAALKRILALYLDFDRLLSEEAGMNARNLVTKELQSANREVVASQAAMRDFLAGTRFDPDGPEGARRPGRSVMDGPVTSARDDQTVTQLKSALVGLQSQLTELRLIYRPESDNVQRLERSITELEARLTEEVARNADNFATFNQRDRALRTAEARSDELNRKLAEIDLFLQINQQPLGNRVIIEPPLLPEKSDWKRRLATGLLGAFVGLILGVALAGISEYTDSTLGSKEAVRRHVGVEVLATIPNASWRERKTLFRDDAPFAVPGAFAARRMSLTAGALASQITSRMNGTAGGARRGRSLVITSARAGEGKTFTATLLAKALVGLGAGNVLLVDANGHERAPYAAAGKPYGSHSDGQDNGDEHRLNNEDDARPLTLTVLTGRNGHGSAGELAGSKLRAFLDRESQRFDWIVFDGGSIGGHGVTALAREVDGVVIVVEADATRRHALQHGLDVLGLRDSRKVRVVLNRKRYHIPAFLYDRV